MTSPEPHRILLGITGGIAAYKSAELVRLLRARGCEVRVVLTEAARHFIGEATMQALSGNPVRSDLWDPSAEAAMGHIELARWADTVLVAPASADFMARLAAGIADDLLTTLCLATQAPLALAPAMNHQMWHHPATRANRERLAGWGVQLIGPASGDQACGEVGEGRMTEPADIAATLLAPRQPGVLHGATVLITAGPTREPIDPVRYMTNRSSGKMGFALAQAAQRAGATVKLVAGPVALPTPPGVQRFDIETAEELYHEVHRQVRGADIFIATAAVADYRPQTCSDRKIKKTGDTLDLKLTRAPDTLASVAALRDRPFTVGFAAETHDLEANARKKLESKNLDLIVANRVGRGLAFDTDDNEVVVLWPDGQHAFGRTAKQQLAEQLVEFVAERYRLAQGAEALRTASTACMNEQA